ncbi:MAG: hypothetical protein ACM3X8_04265 [Methanomicrobiales archaeon]
MEPDTGRAGDDYASYRILVDLWAAENPVKTAKLLALLVVHALLIVAMTLGGGLVPRNWPVCLAGVAFSLVFVLSLGRTLLFQEAWRLKIRALASRYIGEERFQVLETAEAQRDAPPLLRILGGIPSVYYLLGAPLLLLASWLVALVLLLS